MNNNFERICELKINAVDELFNIISNIFTILITEMILIYRLLKL